MKQTLKYFLTFAISISPIFANAGAGVRGGGVVVIQTDTGIVMRFHSQEIPIKRPPKNATYLPGFDVMISAIKGLMIPKADIEHLIFRAMPNLTRNYYLLPEGDATEELRQELLKQYSLVLPNVPLKPGQVVALAAYTEGLDTFIFPSFFKMVDQNGNPDTFGQATLLFHEIIRAEYPVYNTPEGTQLINDVDSAFYARISGGNDVDIYYALAKLTGSKWLPLDGYVDHDLRSGLLTLRKDDGHIIVNLELSSENEKAEKIIEKLVVGYPNSLVMQFFLRNNSAATAQYQGWGCFGGDPVGITNCRLYLNDGSSADGVGISFSIDNPSGNHFIGGITFDASRVTLLPQDQIDVWLAK